MLGCFVLSLPLYCKCTYEYYCNSDISCVPCTMYLFSDCDYNYVFYKDIELRVFFSNCESFELSI